MGCWDETCGLTNTPIFRGQPCVLVILVGSVETNGFKRGWSFADQVIAIHKGTYDGYGRAEGVEVNSDEAATILFHLDVWDAAVEFHGPLESPTQIRRVKWAKPGELPEILPPLPLIDEFTAIMNVACSARRDVLAGLRFKGQQDCEGFAPYKFVASLAKRHLSR